MLIKAKSTQGIPRAKGSLCEDRAGTSSPRMLAAACSSLSSSQTCLRALGKAALGFGWCSPLLTTEQQSSLSHPLPPTPSWPPHSCKEVTLSRKHSKHKCHHPEPARAEAMLPAPGLPPAARDREPPGKGGVEGFGSSPGLTETPWRVCRAQHQRVSLSVVVWAP